MATEEQGREGRTKQGKGNPKKKKKDQERERKAEKHAPAHIKKESKQAKKRNRTYIGCTEGFLAPLSLLFVGDVRSAGHIRGSGRHGTGCA